MQRVRADERIEAFKQGWGAIGDSIVVVGGDGQVTLGNTVMKGNATKVRKIYGDKVIVGFAGATADAFTLLERFEAMLERHGGQLKRSAVELAKDWRTDRMLRRLEALLVVADKEASLILTGTGDVVEQIGRASCRERV